MNPHYPLVAQRAEHRCEYCHAPEVIFNFPFEVDHCIPTSRGGSDEDANLALACRACNLFKTNLLLSQDKTTVSEVRLFHPRQDRWDEHFQVEVETGLIHGLTAVGRVTVDCLKMNSVAQVTSRQHWIKLGLFP
jgi:hypothetical protein